MFTTTRKKSNKILTNEKASNFCKSFAKRLDMKNNVGIRVMDADTGEVVSEHLGHNASTNSLLTGIAHYLTGNGVLNQSDILSKWIPKYMSLGTMGLYGQEEDADGLPANIGSGPSDDEAGRFTGYMESAPGFGADGYDSNENNNRAYFGLGPAYSSRSDKSTTANCELISPTFPRAEITYRDIVPEDEAEYPKTIDVVFGAFISTGALAEFRAKDASGKDLGYIFITEAGLWSSKEYTSDGGDNGLLAGYRIAPPDEANWDMDDPDNRKILKENIIRVGTNQIVQIMWKIQLGGIEQFNTTLKQNGRKQPWKDEYSPDEYDKLRWGNWY